MASTMIACPFDPEVHALLVEGTITACTFHQLRLYSVRIGTILDYSTYYVCPKGLVWGVCVVV